MVNVRELIKKARAAGCIAGEKKLREMQGEGPKFIVKDGFTGRVEGTMLDACGYAQINFPKMNGNCQLWKELKKIHDEHGSRIYLGTYGGKSLDIFDMTCRQEVSVNEAAMEAAAEVFKAAGIDCYVTSRLD